MSVPVTDTMTLSWRLAKFEERRQTSEPLSAGVAPRVSSRQYRSQHHGRQVENHNWDHRLSVEARRQCISTLKTAGSTACTDMLSLSTARPHFRFYPWQSSSLSREFKHTYHDKEGINEPNLPSLVSSTYQLETALNYGYAAGSPQLLRFITEHIELIHDPLHRDWECSITCGSTSALEIVFRVLCSRGDTLLTEAYTYTGTIELAKAHGVHITGVAMDSEGPIPEALERILNTWDTSAGPKPSVLYLIPCGQNPTGLTHTQERRRAIYDVAEQHDLIIIEDDPYYFLQLETAGQDKSLDEYMSSLPRSYLSMDKSGRVLRLDSASKILSPGLRLGWITGCASLIQQFIMQSDFSTGAPAGPSQLMLYKLLEETWGHAGFLQWLNQLSWRYRCSRDTMLEAMSRFLPSDLCRWSVPSCGMFVWLHITMSRRNELPDSRYNVTATSQLEELVYKLSRQCGVQVAQGNWFSVQKAGSNRLKLRLTYAALPDSQLEEAVRRLGQAISTCVDAVTGLTCHGEDGQVVGKAENMLFQPLSEAMLT